MSGADGSADDRFAVLLSTMTGRFVFVSNSSNALHGDLSANAGARLER